MDQPLSRRAWLAALASGVGAVAAAACSSAQGAVELTTPEGRVLQWQGDDLLVLVTGLEERYRPGDTVAVRLLANNQSTRLIQVRLRTRILGRGDQVVAQAEPVVLNVRPEDAASADRQIVLGRSLPPAEYTLSVEVPPWRVEGRETGRLADLRADFVVEPAG